MKFTVPVWKFKVETAFQTEEGMGFENGIAYYQHPVTDRYNLVKFIKFDHFVPAIKTILKCEQTGEKNPIFHYGILCKEILQQSGLCEAR